jgi:hypothetical protein
MKGDLPVPNELRVFPLEFGDSLSGLLIDGVTDTPCVGPHLD